MLRKHLLLLSIPLVIIILVNCSKDQKSLKDMKEYEGPLTTLKNVVNLLSDSGIVKIRLTAPVELEMKNGNQQFPKGLKVEFYERDGAVSSVLTSNKGVFNKATNIFTATGNVVIRNIQKNEQLNTEELHWNRKDKKVYTSKFVTIKTEEELLQGTGLTAAQDFSTYKITDPTGVMLLDNESDEEEDTSSEE